MRIPLRAAISGTVAAATHSAGGTAHATWPGPG